MKGWKKERIRRQQLRKEARKRKKIARDMDTWCELMKKFALQPPYYSLHNTERRKDESESD